MSNDKLFCKYTPNEKNQDSHSKLLGRVFCVDKEYDETYSLKDYCERNDTQVKSVKSLAFHQNFSFVTKAEADQYLEDKNAFVDREVEFMTKHLADITINCGDSFIPINPETNEPYFHSVFEENDTVWVGDWVAPTNNNAAPKTRVDKDWIYHGNGEVWGRCIMRPIPNSEFGGSDE